MADPITLAETMSLVELTIWGFIAANLMLGASYILQRGFQKLTPAKISE